MRGRLGISERRACRVLGQQRRTPMGRDDEDRLVADMIELARQYSRYGLPAGRGAAVRRRLAGQRQAGRAPVAELLSNVVYDGVNQAAFLPCSMVRASTPSMNFTPSITCVSCRNPRSRRQPF